MTRSLNLATRRYSVQPRDRMFVIDYGFLAFAKNVGKNLSSKYSQKLLDHGEQSAKMHLKQQKQLII